MNRVIAILKVSSAVGIVLVLMGCGGASGTPATTPLPTRTPIPVFEFVPPTEPAPVQTAAAATAAAAANGLALDPQAIERGKGRYDALGCAECHGANGEGTDKSSALTDSIQTEAEFISFMRSGGELGAEHQYATNRLSDSGGRNLYQYLLSLRPTTTP
jgi:mono/diheme cytochrome c family protein